MTYKIVITDHAQLQAEIAKDNYDEKEAGLGDRFKLALLIVYEKIAYNPQYYSFVSSKYDVRDVKLQGFPYLVAYRVRGNEVVVVSVQSTYQKPRELE